MSHLNQMFLLILNSWYVTFCKHLIGSIIGNHYNTEILIKLLGYGYNVFTYKLASLLVWDIDSTCTGLEMPLQVFFEGNKCSLCIVAELQLLIMTESCDHDSIRAYTRFQSLFPLYYLCVTSVNIVSEQIMLNEELDTITESLRSIKFTRGIQKSGLQRT